MAKDYTGMKYDRLTALHRLEDDVGRHPKWVFQCDCGNTHVAYIDNVVGGKTRSCGCLQREEKIKRNFKHGLPRDRLYFIWKTMRQRCSNPNKDHYDRYGGRGIRVCEEWREYPAFRDWAIAHGYRDDLTLDRINNDGNYEPSNCRWVTQREQMQNISTTIFLEASGEIHSISKWAELVGESKDKIYQRLRRGWTPEEAIFGRK